MEVVEERDERAGQGTAVLPLRRDGPTLTPAIDQADPERSSEHFTVLFPTPALTDKTISLHLILLDMPPKKQAGGSSSKVKDDKVF